MVVAMSTADVSRLGFVRVGGYGNGVDADDVGDDGVYVVDVVHGVDDVSITVGITLSM